MTEKTKTEKENELYQLITLVAGEFSLQEVLDKLAEAAVKATGVKACSIRLLDDGRGELKMRSTYGLSEEYRNKGEVSRNDTVIKESFSGKAVVLDDMRVDQRVKYRDAAIKEGLISQLTVSMRFRGRDIGVLRLYSPEPNRFHKENIKLARAVASQCAVAITNAKLYSEALEGSRIAEQMRLAGIIQRRMIPKKIPVTKGFDIAATYIPCFDVGGDLYTFHRLNPDHIALSIADVIGKGMPAALMMSSFRGRLFAYVDMLKKSIDSDNHTEKDDLEFVKEITNRLNSVAYEECDDGEFVTMFHAAIDTVKKTFTYCNCGHEPGIFIRNGKIRSLKKGGLVLGIRPYNDYKVETIQLQQGDCIILYTDGLADAVNFDGELWGRERVTEKVKDVTDQSSNQIIKHILAHRRRFAGLARQADDTSIIAIKAR